MSDFVRYSVFIGFYLFSVAVSLASFTFNLGLANLGPFELNASVTTLCSPVNVLLQYIAF